MVRRIAEHVVHHHGVGHGGKIAPRPSSPFSRSVDEGDRGSIARARSVFGNSGSIARKHAVEAAEETEPGRALMRRLGGHADRCGGCRNSSSMPTPRGFLARGFSAASTISGTITVRAQ